MGNKRTRRTAQALPVDKEYADEYAKAQTSAARDAEAISDMFAVLHDLAVNVDAGYKFNELPLHLILKGLACVVEASERQYMLANPEAFRSP